MRQVDPLEGALVGLTAANLCLLPWALGDMHAWSQILSLGLSVAALVVAVWPRTACGNDPEALQPAGTLLRFPVFWAGLAVFGYVAAQGLNPAWRYASDGRSWWITPVAHIPWLPSGMDAPFAVSNPWRALIVYGTVWSLVCATWSGFLRRRSWRLLAAILVGNAALVALLGFLQQLTGATRIFWTYLPSNGSFAASFIYRNHAGAYFNLATALAAGLAWWHFRRAQRRLEGPGAGVVYCFLAFWLGAMVIYTFSRAAVILLLAFTALVGTGIALRMALGRRSSGRGAEPVLLALALAGLLAVPFTAMETDSLWTRFAALATDPAASLADRSTARSAAEDMRRESPLFGWGAGCFRYGFPNFTRWYPSIDFVRGSQRRATWEHAHDDLLEFPIELGELGLVPPAAVLGWGAVRLVRRRFWRHPVSFCTVAGCLLLLAHAGFDFVFQNPAVLVTSGVLFFGAIRWAELEDNIPRRRRSAAEIMLKVKAEP